MTDDELRSTLREWQAPPAPNTLRERVLPRKKSWLAWWGSGEIRIPVPVAVAMLCLLIFGAYRIAKPPEPATLTDFEHVTKFNPRIVRTIHETP
ncbi:MAG: hypothetical protein HYX27_05120 [Acidobacteria bacterium]|nr:hypothetical protein [Acidobacteriota bacterium]